MFLCNIYSNPDCPLLAAQQGYEGLRPLEKRCRAAFNVVTAIEEISETALAIQAEVSDEAAVERMVALVNERFGRLTALINTLVLATTFKLNSPTARMLHFSSRH